LVCPAEFDTGAHKNVMILSVPEGDDKPLKYPLMFSVSDLLLVNKIDYLALSDFDIVALRKRALTLNPRMAILEISCRSGAGIEEWIKWLRQELGAFRK
jgi:hydrogenase nickel incorporation protein HypB